MDHFEKCCMHVDAYAKQLKKAVEQKKLNAWNCENLLSGFVDQPAYYPKWRKELVKRGLTIIGGVQNV